MSASVYASLYTYLTPVPPAVPFPLLIRASHIISLPRIFITPHLTLASPVVDPQKPTDSLAAGESEILHQPRVFLSRPRSSKRVIIACNFEKEAQRQAKLNKTPPPCDYFDFISGISSGGLIAIMLGRLKMVRIQVFQGFNCTLDQRLYRPLYKVKRRSLQS